MHYRKLVSNLDEMNNNYDITAKNKRRFGVIITPFIRFKMIRVNCEIMK